MSVTALNEAVLWADQLMEAETRHRREKEYKVRERLAGKIGVSESYLFRLQYKSNEMRDVRGSVYRALMLGRELYGLACTRIEEAAERMERERREIEETDATLESRSPAGEGLARAARGAAEEEMR